MRKLFTFLFAALMSVGMFAATVTWDNSTLSSIYLHGGDSFTKDGVTLTVLDGMIDGRNFMGFSNDASFKFSTSLGNFTKIEITGNINALGGSGWTQTILGAVWTGEANETTFGMSFDNVSQIVFTIGDPAPTTYTLRLVADPEKGSVAVTNLLGSDIVDNGNGNYTVPENAKVTILATPNEGYEFSGWLEGNVLCDFIDCGTALNTLDNPLTFTMTNDAACKAEFEAEPEVQGVVTLILANLPEENRPATIELAGTFDEGTAELEKLDTGWFIYKFIHASADATGKFRDKTNPNMVLCEFIPANGEEEGKWVQAIFKISDYGYWDEDGWKGTACMWTEIDVTGEQYAWMENAPEPLPTGFENIVLTEKAQKVVVDGMIYIVRDGKLFNMTGAQVR